MNAKTVCKWEDCKVTFYLYQGGHPLTAVRAHICMTPEMVKCEAYKEYRDLCRLTGTPVNLEAASAIFSAKVRL